MTKDSETDGVRGQLTVDQSGLEELSVLTWIDIRQLIKISGKQNELCQSSAIGSRVLVHP